MESEERRKERVEVEGKHGMEVNKGEGKGNGVEVEEVESEADFVKHQRQMF